MERHIAKLRYNLDVLRTVVDEIEAEQGHPKFDDLGELQYRVIHLSDNPYNRAIKDEQDEYDSLKRENERLKARLSQIESRNDSDVTMRLDAAVNNFHHVQELTQLVADYQERGKKIMDTLKKTAWSFREACLLLTGFRVDKLKDDMYKLSLHPNSHDDEHLYFNVRKDGSINLVENKYFTRLPSHVSSYLKYAKSYPAFLAALVLYSQEASNATKLVNQTQAMDISMSTTIVPNPNYLL